MKKSKLLQNSKDLISRSFNPSKCKTSLRLAGSRLKLLRNKKEVQVKQTKREIAQLLECGQDQTARIRVEHVVREEKMMDAYDLLQIYCELVVARLPIIETQKNCPIDLKEAIASLVYAAPRCGDVPELLDVKKQITAKYGKDFTTAATELRPQCGVGRMLVEKLSATAPDGQTKLKILTAIAEGHNVKWDPKSFGDKDYVPENDMGGPSSFTKESELSAKPPHIEAAQVQARPNNNMMNHTSPSNFSQQDDTTSMGPEKLVFAQTPGLSTTFQSEARPAALRNERRQEDRYSSSSIDTPLDRSRWNMEFKDATSAAQAAAESAERANMAARAAAEFSGYGRSSIQYSTELPSHGRISSRCSTDKSQESNVDILKDERREAHPNSKSLSEHTRLKNGKTDGITPNPHLDKTFKEDGAGSSQRYYSQSASLKSKVSVNDDDNMSDHGTTAVDEYYSPRKSLKDVSKGKVRAEKQSFRYETESANNDWLERAENDKEGRIRRDHSIKSSCSQSSTSEDVNIFSNSEYQKIEKDAGEDPSVGIAKIGSGNGQAPQTSSHATADLFIDKSDSDNNDDHSLFDKSPTYDDQEFHLSSSFYQRSRERHTDSWSPRSSSSSKRGNSTSSLFFTREKLPSPNHSENTTLRDASEFNSAPLMFDDSDGPISESDNEDMNTRQTKVDDSIDPLHNQNSVFDSQNLPFSSDDDFSSSLEIPSERNQVSIFDDESSPDDNEGRLDFGKLTGGFRHKGHNQLPFLNNRLDASSSSVKKGSEETTAAINTSTNVDERLERGTAILYHKKNPRKQEDMNSESDSDISEEEVSLPKNSGSKIPVKEVKSKPDSFFDTDNSDLDEDSSKEGSLNRKYHMQRSGISRRTKASPSASKAASHTKTHLRSEALDDSDAGDIATKPTTFSNSEAHRKNSGKWETYEEPTSMPSKSSFWVPPENPGPANTTSVTKHKSKAHDSDASLGKKPPSSHARQELESRRNSSRLGNLEKPNPVKSTSKLINSTLSGKATSTAMQESKSSVVEVSKPNTSLGSDNTSNKDESAKKEASHVHPKLPDYDTLFESLRKNRS